MVQNIPENPYEMNLGKRFVLSGKKLMHKTFQGFANIFIIKQNQRALKALEPEVSVMKYLMGDVNLVHQLLVYDKIIVFLENTGWEARCYHVATRVSKR